MNLPFNPIFYRDHEEDFCTGWEWSRDGKEFAPIHVPFCPESELSGIGLKEHITSCFYRKTFEVKDLSTPIWIHFGACDHETIVKINGTYCGAHVGGYTPFEFLISPYLHMGENLVELTVYDENKSLFGKQTFEDHSFGCYYTRTIGIWQPVSLLYIEENHVETCEAYPHIEEPSVTFSLQVTNVGLYTISVYFENRLVGKASGELAFKGNVTIPLKEKHLWDVGVGNLYDVVIEYDKDVVHTYFGLREVCYKGYEFLLNGRPVFQRLVLDQGFYPDGIYTAPSIDAMQKDIDCSMRLGFNGARLHQKAFDPRFLYLCDKAGYLAWGEYASWGGNYRDLRIVGEFISEWEEVLRRDFNHPAIITWCPTNEVWDSWSDRRLHPDPRVLEEICKFTKAYDPTRPVVDSSGGYHGPSTDLFDIHCYDTYEALKSYLDRFDREDVLDLPLLYPQGVEPCAYKKGQPVNVSEYGGIALGSFVKKKEVQRSDETGIVEPESTGWGYGKGEYDTQVFVKRYRELTELISSYSKISGFCYTQLYDVEQEQNGLYKYDRTPKLSEAEMDEIQRINSARQ